MTASYPRVLAYVVVAIILLQTAYLTFTAKQPVVFRDQHGHVTSIHDLTTLFRLASASAFALAILLLARAGHLCFKRRESGRRSVIRIRVLGPGRIWVMTNAALVALSVYTGWAEMEPRSLSESNPDALLCAVIFFGLPLFVVGALSIAKVRRFRRPSWNRFPLNWWSDPLQTLFVSTLCALGLFVGSLSGLYRVGPRGFWMTASFGSTFLGLLITQILAYRLFRNRIEKEGVKTGVSPHY